MLLYDICCFFEFFLELYIPFHNFAANLSGRMHAKNEEDTNWP